MYASQLLAKDVFLSGKRIRLPFNVCDATGCFIKALPMGQNIVIDKLYTKELGQISILEHCKRQ